MEVHDKDERLDNKVKQELPLMDVDGKIKEYLEKNKPPEEEIVDPKGKKGGKAPPPAAKKEAPKKEPPKKDAKKDTKKKGGELKIEPIREEQIPPIEYQRNNYGVACFFLTDLLKPSVRTVKLRVPIVPLKKYQDFESNNLDLNTTAKKNIPMIVPNSNFFD